MESAKRAAYVRNRSRGRGLRYTKSSFSTLQADIKQTRASDEEVARDIQRCLRSFKKAPVRCECQVASDQELDLEERLIGPQNTKSSFSTLQTDIKQTRASDEKVARDIQRCLGSFQLRITAPVRRECRVASDKELGLKELQRRLGSFKLRITAPVRRECEEASDEELGRKERLTGRSQKATITCWENVRSPMNYDLVE
jgi:hypothetical protein